MITFTLIWDTRRMTPGDHIAMAHMEVLSSALKAFDVDSEHRKKVKTTFGDVEESMSCSIPLSYRNVAGNILQRIMDKNRFSDATITMTIDPCERQQRNPQTWLETLKGYFIKTE